MRLPKICHRSATNRRQYKFDLIYAYSSWVLKDLLEREPKDEKARRRHHLHRWSTEDIGHLELATHIFAAETLMRADTSWEKFYRSMQRALPKQNATIELNIIGKEGETL